MQKKLEPSITAFQHNFFSQIWRLLLDIGMESNRHIMQLHITLRKAYESLLILRIRGLLGPLTLYEQQ